MFKKLSALAFAAILLASTASMAADPANTINLQLKGGTVVIELLPNLAPKHVARVKELVGKGFYDGLIFHRVIKDFMAQTGDPTGTGNGGSGQHIDAEFTAEPFVRGTIGAARTNDPNSADSQFFIVTADSQFLNNQYTLWGRVISGMEFVDQVAEGEPPMNPDKIISMKMAEVVPADANATPAPDATAATTVPAAPPATPPAATLETPPVAAPVAPAGETVPAGAEDIPASDE